MPQKKLDRSRSKSLEKKKLEFQRRQKAEEATAIDLLRPDWRVAQREEDSKETDRIEKLKHKQTGIA